jgi:4-amino-4-deoxy-L-arabinose transferase-like glycosyltransferase
LAWSALLQQSKTSQMFRPEFVVGTVLACVTLWTAARLGIWEPWEAEAARVIRNMLNSGLILSVNTGTLETPVLINSLPYSWWPQLLSFWVFGESELSLRLPNLIMLFTVTYGLYGLSYKVHGQTIARMTALFALGTPAILFHSVLTLGPAVPAGFIALSCLSILWQRFQVSNAERWVWVTWALLGLSTLSCGLIGLLLPSGVWLASRQSNRPIIQQLRAHRVAIAITLLVVSVAVWRASIYRTPGLPLSQWIWFIDGLGVDRTISLRPAFSLYVHQIGFGLFPWGVLAPLAFAILLFTPNQSGSSRRLHTGMFVWFAGAFIYGAVCFSWTHYALFLGAPALAFVLAPFFQQLFSKPRHNGFTVLVAILLLGLVDSNLKHEPRLLAESFVGTDVSVFPAHVWYSRWGRVLNASLLLICIGFGTQIIKWFTTTIEGLLFPKRRPRLTDFGQVLFSISLGTIICAIAQRPLIGLVNRLSVHQLMAWVKLLIVGALISLIIHFVVHYLWSWRHRHMNDRLALPVISTAKRHQLSFFLTGLIAMSWIGLNQFAVATTMTKNFSQRGLLNQYYAHKTSMDDAPLFTYELSDRDRSYYARDLDKMDLKMFTKYCKEQKPFFAVIPQKNLAKVNDKFRAASRKTGKKRGNHIPVLYAGGARFYLVANQLPDGAEDLNPMKRAFLADPSELPTDANKVDIDFEGKVKIIGWKVEPKVARRGSPLKMIVYWQVLKNRVGSWKVFVHMDAPGQRIHGDHDPVAGLLPTTNWRVGDVIVDEHTVNVDRTKSPANFTFYTGLFRGDKRLKVNTGPQDGKNRAKLGIVRLQ